MFSRRIQRTVISLLTLATLAITGIVTTGAAATPAERHRNVPTEERAFHDAMRKVWVDHVTWTRMFIVEFAADSPATEATAARLLQNQADIGDALKPFYGDRAGEQLTALLEDHILIAVDLLAAAKAGDHAAAEEARARWEVNADDIAAFLAAANPRHWAVDDMRAMMRDHLDLTLAQAAARFQGDFEADIAAYDQVHDQILDMADMLSSGIIAQFPQAFRRGHGQ